MVPQVHEPANEIIKAEMGESRLYHVLRIMVFWTD